MLFILKLSTVQKYIQPINHAKREIYWKVITVIHKNIIIFHSKPDLKGYVNNMNNDFSNENTAGLGRVGWPGGMCSVTFSGGPQEREQSLHHDCGRTREQLMVLDHGLSPRSVTGARESQAVWAQSNHSLALLSWR